MDKKQTFSLWYVLAALVGLILMQELFTPRHTQTLTYSEFKQALVAGNDVALISGAQNVDEVYLALVAAVTDGTITEKRLAQSVKRVLGFKGVKGSCPAGGADPKADPADPAPTTAPVTDAPVLERDPVGGGQPTDQG